MPAAMQFPTWIHPEIIPGLPFRWYGLMYAVAFAVAWLLFRYESRRRGAAWSLEDAEGFFFWAIVGLIVGARVFGTLVYYDTSIDYSMYPEFIDYRAEPWFVFWPFDKAWHFTGFQGLSYHGGVLGLIVATVIYCAVKKQSWLAYADVIAVSAPLGYTFGRLGNFINGELWGKVTSSPIGMIFPTIPDSGRFKADAQWVQDAATAAGLRLGSMNDLVNLPRHPSQLYEAFFEGLVLWFVLWVFVRKRESFRGFATGLYVIGYGAIRFVIEYFREPDEGMGFILGNKSAPTYVVTSLFNISMGQILSFFMIVGGVLIIVFCSMASKGSMPDDAKNGDRSDIMEHATRAHEKSPNSPRQGEAQRQAEQRRVAAAQARKLRKRIK
jgi:phosphatidylglycerol---prolipoprotein diacylglyceryl transferase